MSKQHIPKFLQRKMESNPLERGEARTPKWNIDRCNHGSIRFISPKANGRSGEMTLGKAIQTTNQGRVIVLMQKNSQLRQQVVVLKKQRVGVIEENDILKEKLKQSKDQVNHWKQRSHSFQCGNGHISGQSSTFQDTTVHFNILSSLNNLQEETFMGSSINVDDVYPDSEFHLIVKKNQILEQSLTSANKLIAKMRYQVESSHVNVRIMQRRLQAKDKEVAKYKAKSQVNQRNLFQLSDDE